MERADESLYRKHFIIHEDVMKFGQAIYEYSLKMQAIGISIIKNYSDTLSTNQFETTQIVPVPHLETRKQQIDADQLSTGKQTRS